MDNLTKWLRENCSNITESKNTGSVYYDFDNIKVRVSDHLTTSNVCEIHVIKTLEGHYICFTKDYKYPNIFKKTKEVLFFVKSYLQYCLMYDHINNKTTFDLKFLLLKKVNNLKLSTSLNSVLIDYIQHSRYAQLESLSQLLDTNACKKNPSVFIKRYFNIK